MRLILSKRLSYADHAVKDGWHRASRTYLRRLGKRLEARYGKFTVRSNLGGIAVSGEVTLHMDTLYVQLSQSSMGRTVTDKGILFRSCQGLKDYTGGTNNFADAHMLVETEELARFIETKVAFKMRIE
jgi:hypothetical protein